MELTEDRKKFLIIILTLVIAYIITILPFPEVFSGEAKIMIAITVIGAVFWITECIPIAMTALVIMVLQGLLGIQPIGEALSYIATPVNSLIFAGFIIASAFSKYDIDKRVSLKVISLMGEKTDKLILGIMAATAFLSMWISNTASTAIMIPIALGIINMEDIKKGKSNLGKAMLIGIAYAANVGGMGTPAGTPASSITVVFLNDMADIQVTFLEWMMRAVPIVIVIVPLIWLILCYVIFPLKIKKIKGGSKEVEKKLKNLGALTNKQKHVFLLFFTAVFLWIADSFFPLISGWIYIASVFIILLFLAPVIGVVKWKEVKNEIGWGVFILVGGGLSLGSGLTKVGIIEIIADFLSKYLVDFNVVLVVSFLAIVTAFSITLFSSLTATSSTFVPIAITLAVQFGMSETLLGMAAGLGACLAFLLPANTPPNAISYSYGYYKTYEMTKAGVPITIVSVVILSILINLLRFL